MNTLLIKRVTVALAAAALAACGSEDSSSPKSDVAAKVSAKPAPAKAVEDAPRVVDPAKDGY